MHATNAAATTLLTTRTGRSSAGTRNPNGAYGGSAGCHARPFLVAGYVLVTIREAFAVAPSLVATRVAVVRASEPDAYGLRRLECLLAARFARQALTGIRWDERQHLDLKLLPRLARRNIGFTTEDLDSYPPAERPIARLINLGHPAPAEQTHKSIA